MIGEAQQQWAPLRRRYNLFLARHSLNAAHDLDVKASQMDQNAAYTQFAYVDEPFLSWNFSLKSEDDRLIGSVNRNFAGFGREIFTDTGVYALRMDAAGLAEEPRHLISQTGNQTPTAYNESGVGMTLDQRAVMLATAVTVDFDYFSRKSGSGMGIVPIPIGGGGAAAEGGAATGAGAGAGAIGGAVSEESVAAGASGAVAGGVIAGSNAVRGGPPLDDASPVAGDVQQPVGESQEWEEIWGESSNSDPPQGSDNWPEGGNTGSSSGGGGGGGGGGNGEGGSWFDLDEWL